MHWKKPKQPWPSPRMICMARYYNQKQTPSPNYRPGDKVYLDASNIQTSRRLRKLSHQRLRPFPVVKEVGNGAYQLQLPPSMSWLHPVFNVVKLTPAPLDPIEGHHPHTPPLPEMIDGKEEWIVEKILDSKLINRKLRYLVKFKGFGVEHISLEPWDNIHALEHVADFYWRHPGAAPLHPRQCQDVTPLKRGGGVRRHPIPPQPLTPFL